MSIEINEIINKFVKFYDNIKLDTNENIKNEVELTLINPDLMLLSNIYTENNESKKKTYLEYNLKFSKKKSKLRQRHEYDYSTYEIPNSHLTDRLTNNWETKTVIDEEKIDINKHEHVLMRHNIEYIDNNIELPLINDIFDRISVIFVSQVYIIIDSVLKIEFKIKSYIGPLSSNKLSLSTHFNDIDTSRKNISYYLEIEILPNIKLENNILQEKLEKAFSYIYKSTNISNLSLVTIKEPSRIKTFTIQYNKLNTIDKDSYVMAIKIDGNVVNFTVKNSICSVIIYNVIYKNYKCNIDKNIEIKGMGEYIKVNNVKKIYPFYFTEIKYVNRKATNIIENRYDQIQFYNSIITSFKEPMQIKFENKLTLKFNENNVSTNVVNFYKSIDNSNMKDIYDGIILIDISNNKDKKDYKFKIDNTVDIVCRLDTYRGVYILHSGGKLHISFSLFAYDDKNFAELTKYTVKSDIIKYISDANLLVFNNNDKFGPSKLLSPIYCIVEYSFLHSKIIGLRIDKTNNFYRQNYNGNSLDVIILSKQIHEQFPSNYNIDYLLSLNESSNIIDNNPHRSKLLLNKKVDKYFLDNTVRTSINILTNYMKTNAISMSISRLVTVLPNRYVLSIDIGRGGDLTKYYYVGISGILGTDPDTIAIQESRERYKNLQLKSNAQSSVYKFHTLNISILNDNYENDVKQSFMNQQKINFFGVIEWQLAIHYSYNNNTKDSILLKLKNLSSNGTKVIITCLDGNELINRLNINEHIIYNIQPGITYKITKISEDRISVLYNATMTNWLEEYIITDGIIYDFAKYNFILHDMFTFEDIFNKNTYKTIDILSNFGRKSTNMFYKTIKNDSNIYNNEDINKLMSLFKVYIFIYSSYN
ncbi:mRNA capping enzyme large subunit [Mythimna separata entomopoxvirus 'L']|uniref:mRNA-capping enzyme catalytic subunit n=1 Tax=Mythimna separata entomopoxvirus 'L' TaxID=1293572 RepID=A0A916KQK7_9POXV|nr:mRNA capping enzyme large subunit [Mythimna separata entomopoxvirus 'L']CCU56376.1 mRNA capping enzyme large subunit [Mythimna separata entomopoxvirus 'L']